MSDEGEDTPQRPKRRIRKVTVLSSASDSDSDDGVVAATRRKRMRVVSEEDSDSSDTSVVCVGTRRRRALPRLRDSDGASDATASGASSRATTSRARGRSPRASNARCPPPAATLPGASPRTAGHHSCGFASDSSEGNSDKCSICLLRFTNQEVGTPETCEHMFCLDCITEWSKNVNTCPVDRLTFNSIVVRAFAGGRVLRSEPVRVVERRPSVDMLVVEDMTVCEVCGRTDDEESMLLCDGCDLGYHMQCLTPPLRQVPANQWLCPNCFNLLDMNLSDVDDLIPDIADIDEYIQMAPLLLQRARLDRLDQPSTSSGRRGASAPGSAPGPAPGPAPRASRSSRPPRHRTATTTTTPAARRKRTTRNNTTTVIIEYEEDGNGKRPILKRVKRRVKKRKTRKRQPRTAARRSLVRQSVRAKLASMKVEQRLDLAPGSAATSGVQDLSVRRHRAGIPALNLLGNPNQLDYFSEDEDYNVSQGASLAVATRPTSHILNSYRQARRKMVTVSSPQHASSASDVLSSILESQTLLHSKNSVLSISVDGNVNIKLETRQHKPTKNPSEPTKDSRVDVSKAEDSTRKVPSYPGQSRGGGWGGGYRGNYHREQGTTGFGRGSYTDGNYGGGYQNRQGNTYQNTNARREDADTFNNYARRPHQYSQSEDNAFERNRRHSDAGRGVGHNQHGLHNQRHEPGRYGAGPGPVWQPYSAAPNPVAPRHEPPPSHRHSFGGFDNPLDMRTGHMPHHMSGLKADDAQMRDRAQPYRPLPEPPIFQFNKTPEVEKSEDERSDSSLVIDTDKYDPTEPTRDDDSGDDERVEAVQGDVRESPEPPVSPAPAPAPAHTPASTAPETPTIPTASETPVVKPLSAEPVQLDVRSALASLDASGLGVPPSVLDSAVRQVLKEHRDLLAPSARPVLASDDDSDGDCPNFSIYSATSVHIANNSSVLGPEEPRVSSHDSLEDLVQEDDTPTPEPDEPESEPDPPTLPIHIDTVRKKENEYKEKVSKRCPITTNTRNPIKIKLHTPSLIKRHVSLYDEEEEEGEEVEETALADEPTDTDLLPSGRQDSSSEKKIDKEKVSVEVNKETTVETPEKTKDSKELSFVEKDIDGTEQGDMTPEPRTKRESPRDETLVADCDHNEESEDLDELVKDKLGECEENEQKSENEHDSDDEASESESLDRPQSRSPKASVDRNDDALEKMTESISETEDERSYTPCLDENKSKDTSLETDKDKGIEGLDTEMISEDEGNEMFSEEEQARSEPSRASPPPCASPTVHPDPPDEKKEVKPELEVKKKKKKDSKKEVKDRGKGKRKADVAFKKLSKSGKERNYRERDKEGAGERERRDSTDSAEREKRKRKRKEKRKDLERYDVRTVVSEKRRKRKDPFGRDVSPRVRSRSPSLSRSPPPRRSVSRVRRSTSRIRRSISRVRRSTSRVRRSTSRIRRSTSRVRRSLSRVRGSPPRRRRSNTPRASPSPTRVARSPSPRAATPRRRRRSLERAKRAEPRRRRSADRARKRRRSATGSKSPRPKSTKRKKRARSERAASRRRSPRRKSPRRRRARRRSGSRVPEASPVRVVPPVVPPETAGWSPGSVDSRLASPRTPPPVPAAEDVPTRRRRDPERARHRRVREAGGASKEVFTSGDNILVSVSFKEQERVGDEDRRERRRERRRRRRRPIVPEPDTGAARPVAIIDLERSPFRELTPSPRNVIVLSDSEPGERECVPAPEPAAMEPVGPKTPPEPAALEAAPQPEPEELRGPNTPPEPPDSPDAYDPYEPTRSASASPSPVAASPPRTNITTITLETAQKTNMSADEVLDRRPLSPIEKVMALLQSTREVSPEPPPEPTAASEAAPPAAAAPAPSASAAAATGAPAVSSAPTGTSGTAGTTGPPVRIVLPEPTRAPPPKLFLAKPSPIKSDPIKPMQAAKLPRPAPADSPYSPGSSDFGELFEPPPGSGGGGGGGGGGGAGGRRDPFDALAPRPRRKRHGGAAKVPVKLGNKGKMQVGVKIDEDNLKILDDLPSSAVEMQVKSKFLKKLNRQERVVEEVKLVLKPHYNKKHVTKDEYKDILRRAVPKICHNKSGEINPTKIQALIEAYVKKIRKKHKLGLV